MTLAEPPSVETMAPGQRGVLSIAPHVQTGGVDVRAAYDGGELQRAFDARFGPDAVAVTSALRPPGGR